MPQCPAGGTVLDLRKPLPVTAETVALSTAELPFFISKADEFPSAVAAEQTVWLPAFMAVPPCIAAFITAESSLFCTGSLGQYGTAVSAYIFCRRISIICFTRIVAAAEGLDGICGKVHDVRNRLV